LIANYFYILSIYILDGDDDDNNNTDIAVQTATLVVKSSGEYAPAYAAYTPLLTSPTTTPSLEYEYEKLIRDSQFIPKTWLSGKLLRIP
jgi:hypothetical protein